MTMSKLQKAKQHARRTTIGIIGGIVLIVGIIAIPYPGPGWLIVFAGLAILATEFEWAQTILDKVKGRYDNWQDWVKRQSRFMQLLFLLATSLLVVVTIWLLNGYGFLNDFLNLGLDWVDSPLPIFS